MERTFLQVARQYWPINLAMAGLVCALFLHSLANGDFVGKTYDMPSRLALFVLIFWSLLLLTSKELRNLQWGLMLGALVGAVVLCIATGAGSDRPAVVFLTPIIPFGNVTFLMGALALFSIGWNNPNEKILIGLKLLAGCAGLYASYLSQTRGAWIAVPVFFVFAMAVVKSIPTRHKVASLMLLAVLLATFYTASDVVQTRIEAAQSDIDQYLDGSNRDTSVGIRFQLWKGSWLLFQEHPFFGVGVEQYRHSLKELAARHVITPEAATYGHAHNDILFGMSTLGIFGMFAILALYVVPAFYFFRGLRHADAEVRTVASMGLVLVAGFFVFGLTEVMFFHWTANHAFYSMMMAVLFAHMVKRKAEVSSK
ncbi:MAG: O-antigen ligase [Burkholderiales bacterium]